MLAPQPRVCASVVALMAFALPTEGAFAGANDPITGAGVGLGKPCRDAKGNPCAGADQTAPTPTNGRPNLPGQQDQSNTVNTSRSNIKNN